MNKYEQLIEHIINNDEAKARALFHDIVVEKSRDIYESLMDEEYAEEDIHSQNPVDSMVDEITMDETHIGEDEEDGEIEFDMDHEGEDGELGGELGGEFGDEEMGGEEGDLETKVMDLEAELEALRAEFEELQSGEEGEDHGDEMDFGGDDEGSEEEGDEEEGDEEEMYESSEEDDDEEEEDDEEMTESVQRKAYPKTAVDLMREYVEKISAPSNTEFTPVGTGAGGDKPAGNTKNPLAGKNDMGGTTQNIAKGGTGADTSPDGTSPKWKADGNLVKKPQEIDVAKRNVNKPGGNKGAQDWYKNKSSAKKGEGQTTDGSVPTNKKSIEPGGN